MTEHPCKGMTKAQIEAFEQIAIGNALPTTNKSTLAKLRAKELIYEDEPKVFKDRFGAYSIPQYFVPYPVHMKWCEWCSEQPENQE